MGKCLGKQTPPPNQPMLLNTEVYQEKAHSEQIQDKENLRIAHSIFVAKQYTRIQDNYSFIGELGDGNYGRVRKALHKSSNQLRAIKQIYKNKIDRNLLNNQNMLKEIQVLKQLDHPNIVKLYEFYEDSKYFYLVTELCEGGELFQRIIEKQRLNEFQAAYVMKQLLNAVKYLHANNIVHRDLKPENLVLQSADPKAPLRIKLIDFGTSSIFNPNEKMGIKLGTPYYIAPEVIDKLYNFKCDIWSCGVVMYTLLSGKLPFAGRTEHEILYQVQKGQYNLERGVWPNISSEAKDLIKDMLQIDPDKRPSTWECINHPWILLNAGREAPDSPFARQSLKNLKQFKTKQKLQKAVVNFIASHLTTQEEKQDLISVFKQLDIDNDGRISSQELVKGLQQ